MSRETPVHKIDWETLVPPEQWAVYRCVLTHALQEGLQFALGGGLAVGVYTGKPRNTKDLDMYIRPKDYDRLVAIMSGCGLTDYYETKPYDRGWIYRGAKDDVIVDGIWAMANRRAEVDGSWLSLGTMIDVFDTRIRLIPAEELIWSKLYVLQRDRCDWPDILNLINATGPYLDWAHLLDRVAEDRPLLKSILSIFGWMSPERGMSIPRQVWDLLELPLPKTERDPDGRPSRPDLLDTRPWFGEHLLQSAA